MAHHWTSSDIFELLLLQVFQSLWRRLGVSCVCFVSSLWFQGPAIVILTFFASTSNFWSHRSFGSDAWRYLWRHFSKQFDEGTSCTWLRVCDNVKTWDEDVRKKLGDIPSAKAENTHQKHQQQNNQLEINTEKNFQQKVQERKVCRCLTLLACFRIARSLRSLRQVATLKQLGH